MAQRLSTKTFGDIGGIPSVQSSTGTIGKKIRVK